MRVAFVGKGGAGKSAIAGTFARALARRGEPVLALDSDPLPGLAFSLGLEIDDAPIPDEAIVERGPDEEGYRFRLRPGLSAEEAVETYAAKAPDGVRFLQFGKIRGAPGALMRSQLVFRQICTELPDNGWNIVGDLPGGTRQAFFGWGSYADTLFVVVDPTAKSLLSARRLARLALGEGAPRVAAVANRVREADDVELIARRTGLEVVAAVPWDDAFGEADRMGRAAIDVAPDAPAVQEIEALVERMQAAEGVQPAGPR